MCPTIASQGDYLMLSKANDELSSTQKLAFQTVADDELIEASMSQRVSKIKSNFLDEYWSELLAYRQELGATRRHS
ncbi:MAG: hypothetical protein ACFCU7_03950 [Pleurocapsa sp.]